MTQVLANYLSNALRHAPDGSRITVGVGAPGGTVLSVADEGPGLDAGPARGGVRALLPG